MFISIVVRVWCFSYILRTKALSFDILHACIDTCACLILFYSLHFFYVQFGRLLYQSKIDQTFIPGYSIGARRPELIIFSDIVLQNIKDQSLVSLGSGIPLTISVIDTEKKKQKILLN
ncbi:hypothetical protein BY458DRAFT_486020 [Sporodiniella umbellata]|nr:hypothetical protein BY458DRAFT_486020 [Sporodiniella umbellata]